MLKLTRSTKLAVTAILAASGLPLLTTSAGVASTAQANMAKSHAIHNSMRVRSAMRITGFDAQIARKHGYRVFRFRDGTQLSVLPTRLAKLGARPTEEQLLAAAAGIYRPGRSLTGRASGPTSRNTPGNIVPGACGDSYIFVSAANNNWSLLTGYDVIASVDDFDWVTTFRDPFNNLIKETTYGNYSYPTGKHWSGTDGNPPRLAYTDESEYWKGYVHFGITFLTNGVICHSGPPVPYDSTNNP